MSAELLPGNSTPWERAVAAARDGSVVLDAPIRRIRNAKRYNPPSDFVPFLVYEYGLGELTPFVPNLYQLLLDGIGWQRVRGTHAAVAIGLAWVGAAATIEEALARRLFWNSFQLHLTALPAVDSPDLDRIENISALSVPIRSKLRRSTYQHDVRSLETDVGRMDRRRLDGDSGVRIRAGGPLWSFGRVVTTDHILTEDEGEALLNWLPPADDEPLAWEDMQFPWTSATFPWVSSAQTARAVALAGWFAGRRMFQVLRDAGGQVIGYRRARVVQVVHPILNGRYSFNGAGLSPLVGGDRVYIESMTDFGNGAGQTATSTALVVGGVLKAGVPPGKLWLAPDELIGGVEIAPKVISIPLRQTVRERFQTLLRF